MPLSKYDRHFGGKPGSATKAHAAMVKQYGPEKGERVFYATKNRNATRGRGRLASTMRDAQRKVRQHRKRRRRHGR